jgi:hypothetical protein
MGRILGVSVSFSISIFARVFPSSSSPSRFHRKGYVLNAPRSQFLEFAIVCFSREGYHRTTMQDAVKQARLTPGAIYNFFESKEETIEAIASERHAKERRLVTNDCAGSSPRD